MELEAKTRGKPSIHSSLSKLRINQQFHILLCSPFPALKLSSKVDILLCSPFPALLTVSAPWLLFKADFMPYRLAWRA